MSSISARNILEWWSGKTTWFKENRYRDAGKCRAAETDRAMLLMIHDIGYRKMCAY